MNEGIAKRRAAREEEALRAKRAQERSQEIISVGFELATYYIEGGMRSFSSFSRQMVAVIGGDVKPYLKMLYNSVRDFPGAEHLEGEMDDYMAVRAADIEAVIKETEKMTINEMAQMAKAAWKVQGPETYQLMVSKGELEREALAAAELTQMEIDTLLKSGMTPQEAWEASRELFILRDPEENYRQDY